MSELELTVFDYNYSSWSMRAGVVLRASALPFRERAISLEESRGKIGSISPSRLLPVLQHGELRVWDSLAIAEYVAELCPERQLWPHDRATRALARAASAEMHSGFAPMRALMTMNIRARFPGFPRPPEVERNVGRIQELWRELRTRFAERGPFLCGTFGIVDAMYAPVVMRFRTYDVKLDDVCEAYAGALCDHPAVRDWLAHADSETTRVPDYEYIVDGR